MKEFDAQHVEQSIHVNGKSALWYLDWVMIEPQTLVQIYFVQTDVEW